MNYASLFKNRPFILPLCFAVVTVLSGCGGAKTESPKNTQVVAKVNDTELSVHQLNLYLQNEANIPADRLPIFKKEILNKLIEQEGLVQEAMLKKLDRDPVVLQQLEASKKEVLVRAYLQRVAAAVPAPDQAAIDKFYAEKSAMFTQRKVYRFAEINLPGKPIAWPEIEKALLPTKNISEVASVLKAKGIELPIAQNVVRGTEDLPMDQIEKFLSLPDGEVVIYPRPPGITIAQILSSKEAPVDAAKAKPVIERFLMNKARTETVQAEQKRVKESLKITYMGEFAPDSKSDGAALKSANPQPQNPKDDAKALEQGLKGLK